MLPGKTLITTDTSLAAIKNEVRRKTIDEFVEQIMEYCSMSDMNRKMIRQIAEYMKTQWNGRNGEENDNRWKIWIKG